MSQAPLCGLSTFCKSTVTLRCDIGIHVPVYSTSCSQIECTHTLVHVYVAANFHYVCCERRKRTHPFSLSLRSSCFETRNGGLCMCSVFRLLVYLVQAVCNGVYMGAIVCKLDQHRCGINRGYIAMLTVDKAYRRRRVGTTLVHLALDTMMEGQCDEVVLETEVTNQNALSLYERLGFCRDKRLVRYYLNNVDALRLKLWLT
eukprot:scpid95206/ scgid6666/ N-alpha-acetyltransferase 30; N-acetyltransferase 12; N-acetyltransferase MAK3 homolog; NatC catalytic subunit